MSSILKAIANINWIQVGIYFVAVYIFIHAFENLAFLYIEDRIPDNIQERPDRKEYIGIIVEPGKTAGYFGYTVAAIIALTLTYKKKYSLISTFIALAVALFVVDHDRTTIRKIVNSIYNVKESQKLEAFIFLLNGILYTGIGLLVFFSRRIQRYIETYRTKSGTGRRQP